MGSLIAGAAALLGWHRKPTIDLGRQREPENPDPMPMYAWREHFDLYKHELRQKVDGSWEVYSTRMAKWCPVLYNDQGRYHFWIEEVHERTHPSFTPEEIALEDHGDELIRDIWPTVKSNRRIG